MNEMDKKYQLNYSKLKLSMFIEDIRIKLETKINILFAINLIIVLYFQLKSFSYNYFFLTLALFLFLILNKKIPFLIRYLISISIHLILSSIRFPDVMFKGRFFAEEGSIYWTNMLTNKFFNTLFYQPTLQGYFTLDVNLIFSAARQIPIEWQPFFVSYLTYFLFYLPSLCVAYFARENKYKEKLQDISIILIFLPTLNFSETFANSINLQIFLSLTSLIIIIFGLTNLKFIRFEIFFIILSGFSSIYTVILYPLLLLRYILFKEKVFFKIFLITLIPSIFQTIVYFYLKTNNFLIPRGFYLKENYFFNELRKIVINSYIFNLFGETFVSKNNFEIYVAVLLATLFFIFIKQLNKKTRKNFILLIISYLLNLFLIIFGSYSNYFHQRYAAILSTIAFLIICLLIFNAKIFEKFMVYILIISFLNFFNQDYTNLNNCQLSCPSWKQQLQLIETSKHSIIYHYPIEENSNWITDFNLLIPQYSKNQNKIIKDAELNVDYNLSIIKIMQSILKYITIKIF